MEKFSKFVEFGAFAFDVNSLCCNSIFFVGISMSNTFDVETKFWNRFVLRYFVEAGGDDFMYVVTVVETGMRVK